jgi:hypothetical protein
MSIPFSRFDGRLKQLETNFKLPVQRDLFDAAFSSFDGLDKMYAALQEVGINKFVTAAGTQLNTGRRPRRFAGDTNLEPGRYFTLCSDNTFNDHGTLRDEMYGYYRGDCGVDVQIYDPNVDKEIFAGLHKMGTIPPDILQTPFKLFLYDIPRRTTGNQHLLDRYPEYLGVKSKFPITYGVRRCAAKIEKVVDLRQPNTQDWFLRTFVDLELANEAAAAKETGISFPPKKRLTSFAELLPVIVSLETGGGNVFGQAVGAWLRQQGADGLIFPSARANANCRVRKGKVLEFRGWNMVLYLDSPPPTNPNLFGRAATWLDADHDHIRVTHTAAGPERGSFSIRGTKEWNLLHFDLERRIAHGRIDSTSPGFVLGAATGTTNFALTNNTKIILDGEADNQTLWFHETQFVMWHEKRWNGKGAKQ